MQYSGIYDGVIHSFCAEYDYTENVEFQINDDGSIIIPDNYLGVTQNGKVDNSGNVTGLSENINSQALGYTNIPMSGTDNGSYFSISGLNSNGNNITVQANFTQPLPPHIDITYNDDGTHLIRGTGDDLNLQSISNDVMTGGGTRDSFAFTPGFGQDEITDFVTGGGNHDVLDLSATRYQSLTQVLHHTTMGDDGSATIHLNPHDSITLDGVTKSQLAHHSAVFAFS